jgi:hypothetical protein
MSAIRIARSLMGFDGPLSPDAQRLQLCIGSTKYRNQELAQRHRVLFLGIRLGMGSPHTPTVAKQK